MILWALASSDAVQAAIKDSYKQARHDDDLNQPLSIQPWGQDGDKRRYWLIEGQDDTNFRLYRESNIKLKHNTWWSVAGGIDELKLVGEHLHNEGSQAARRLSDRINLAIPRFEATEEVRNVLLVSAHGPRSDLTCVTPETTETRVSSRTESSIPKARAWLFLVRRPHTRQEDPVYLLFG